MNGSTVPVYDTTQNDTGNVEVLNYLQDTFPTIDNFISKSVKDLIFGIGDGPQNKRVVRPNLTEFLSYDTNTNTGVAVAYNLIIDKIRGARFGLLQTSSTKRKFVFSSRSYGQFADKIEQPIDTTYAENGSNPSSFLEATNRSVSYTHLRAHET